MPLETVSKPNPRNNITPTTYSCPECGISKPSFQQLQLHLFSSHKIRNPLGMYINNTHCTICLKEFHTRECLLNHLRYRAPACRTVLLMKGPIISREEADIAARGEAAQNRKLYANAKKRYHKDKPCVQLLGPLPLLYYYRFGFQWHNGTRNRPPNKNNKYSHFRCKIQNNKHGNWVFDTYFRNQGDEDLGIRAEQREHDGVGTPSTADQRSRDAVMAGLAARRGSPCGANSPTVNVTVNTLHIGLANAATLPSNKLQRIVQALLRAGLS